MPKDIDTLIKHAVDKKRIEIISDKEDRKDLFKNIRNYVSIPVIVGIAAAWIYYLEFGWVDLRKVILSWLIGMTLIATLIGSIVAKLDRRKRN